MWVAVVNSTPLLIFNNLEQPQIFEISWKQGIVAETESDPKHACYAMESCWIKILTIGNQLTSKTLNLKFFLINVYNKVLFRNE